MKETKKMKFTECLSHLFVFIKPYRFKLLFGILMVITAQVTFALNPTVEGMITTQLAADISAHQPIQVDKVVHILCILFSIYIVKFPTKSENNLKYALQTVKNHPSRLLFSQNILNLFQNKSKIFQAS